jgi:hypothetical protein
VEAENDGSVGEKMTDEERKKLCAELRIQSVHQCGAIAADEIERLALAQSNAETVTPTEARLNDARKRIKELEAELRAILAQSDAEQPHHAASRDYWRRSRAADAQSDAEPVAWQLVPKIPTEEMVEAHFAAHARAKTIFAEVPEIWKAMLDVAPAPPHPDASTGLIEAAEIADKSAKYHQHQYNLVNTVKQQLISSSKAMVAEEIAKNIRARAVYRNAK